jgi:two-component system sensor histidine kinase SenX3
MRGPFGRARRDEAPSDSRVSETDVVEDSETGARSREELVNELARADDTHALFVDAFDAFGDGVVVVDELGVEVLHNRVVAAYRRARGAEVLAEQAVQELLARALEGDNVERELRLFGPPRQVLSLRAIPLRRADASIAGAVAFVRDVSDARRIENVRRDFVANVSHELKTPIGALALLAETMAADTDPVIMRQLADRVVREADRLARIIDELLDLSIIEAHEALVRDSVPVQALVDEAIERVSFSAASASIPLEVEAIGRDLRIECDRGQVVSALTNLLDNAVKYSEAGSAVSVSAEADAAGVVISVRDHGIGIPSSDLERIFERFYRVDRARSRATGGTGLGLAIVRHVALAHGGEVGVESTEGEGTTFRLLFPVESTADPTLLASSEEAN